MGKIKLKVFKTLFSTGARSRSALAKRYRAKRPCETPLQSAYVPNLHPPFPGIKRVGERLDQVVIAT